MCVGKCVCVFLVVQLNYACDSNSVNQKGSAVCKTVYVFINFLLLVL